MLFNEKQLYCVIHPTTLNDMVAQQAAAAEFLSAVRFTFPWESRAMMEEDRFWEIIAETRQRAIAGLPNSGDLTEAHEATLRAELLQLRPEQVEAFDAAFTHFTWLAYRWPLWNAAYWYLGGCSDDWFFNFRANLISFGREWYFRVVNDPDALAEIEDEAQVLYGESFHYIPDEVYTELTERDMPHAHNFYPMAFSRPVGEGIDVENRELMQQRFPRLFARFPEGGW